ncbi:hypothetical protein GQ53DRAFT_796431 [Thozetella sp. PMI_491]|nr:hypothetical protein GQ53DRAFT_796431 [Thozetella sp. PMI_491]
MDSIIDTAPAETRSRALLETTSRLLACLANERLVSVSIVDGNKELELHLAPLQDQDYGICFIIVPLAEGTTYSVRNGTLIPELDPSDIVQPPTVPQPDKVFEVVQPWICPDTVVGERIRQELKNSADNQEKWLLWAQSRPLPDLSSSFIEWEQSCITGHPTHPMHRTCLPSSPMEQHEIESIEHFLTPDIAFVSLTRDQIHVDGPFEELLAPLLKSISIGSQSPDRLTMPCFAAQLPTIRRYFGSGVTQIYSAKLSGACHASIRTVSINGFPVHVKMPLTRTITSALRTITPWTARMCIEVSELLHKLLPRDIWVFRELAAVCSVDNDFEVARHLTVLLREDLEPRARDVGQCLILPASLTERGSQSSISHAERLFNLKSLEARKDWFTDYTRCFLCAFLPPLVDFGICLEAHQQNVVIRFDKITGSLCGFAYRDTGGLRMHIPTLKSRGIELKTAVPGAVTLTEDLDEIWDRAYHDLLVNHLGGFIRGLGLRQSGGWSIVRNELVACLSCCTNPLAAQLLEYFTQKTIRRKAFLRMKLAGVYRNVSYNLVPHIP